MTLDKKAIERLLTLDDAHLRMIMGHLAADAGIDPKTLNLTDAQLQGLRSALSLATDSDLERAGELIQSYKSGKKNIPRR